MHDAPLIPLQPDEALHAFMDGELELHDEQPLFDSLAADPSLRSEMKDILSIRGAVHRDVLFPSPAVETGILAAAGLTSGAAVVGAAGAGAVAASSSWLAGLSSLAYTTGGIIVGAVVMYFAMTHEASNTSVPTAIIASSIAGEPLQPTRVTVFDTVVVRKVVAPEPAVAQLRSVATNMDVVPLVSETQISEPPIEVSEVPNSISTFDGLNTNRAIQTATSQGLLSADRMSPMSSTLPIMFSFRTLASGLDKTQPTPESVQNTFLPNTAFSLTMPLSEQHRLGVEMGTESFSQTYSGIDGDHEAQWSQTPVLFWLGATYQFTPTEFRILPGLSPFAQATIGAAFSQGPVGRATIGLAYQPIGPVRITLGLDGSALFYTFQSSWFTSTKWGLSYGLSIDLGAWR